jgi:hypothetical protein
MLADVVLVTVGNMDVGAKRVLLLLPEASDGDTVKINNRIARYEKIFIRCCRMFNEGKGDIDSDGIYKKEVTLTKVYCLLCFRVYDASPIVFFQFN